MLKRTVGLKMVVRTFKNISILVIGDLILDRYISGTVSRISPESPVPVLSKNREWTALGGSGNVVNNISTLGGKVRIVSCVGNDYYGSVIKQKLQAVNADIEFVLEEDGRTTPVKTRVMSGNHQFVRIDEETISDVPETFVSRIKDNSDSIFDGIDLVVISDYNKGMISHKLCTVIIGESKIRGIPVVVDPKGNDWYKYSGATVCTPNLKELSDIAGLNLSLEKDRIVQAGKDILDRYGMSMLLVTRSEDGITLIEKDYDRTYPVNKKEVIDVSGAGDTVVSTFSLCYGSGMNKDDCCTISNIAASIVVSKQGTATVSLDELNAECTRSKIITLDEALTISRFLHSKKKKVVFTNGCFDLLHPGHIKSLQEAKGLGDCLFVGLNSDDSVKRLKGEKRPIMSEKERAHMLESLEIVDYIIIFEEDTPLQLITTIKPDILVKGSDYRNKKIEGQDYVESYGGHVKLIDLKEGFSTTSLIQRIRE